MQSLKYFTELQQCGICTETDIYTNGTEQKTQTGAHKFQSLNTWPKIHWKKENISTNGFVGSGCPHAELNQTHTYHFTQKLTKRET